MEGSDQVIRNEGECVHGDRHHFPYSRVNTGRSDMRVPFVHAQFMMNSTNEELVASAGGGSSL